MSSLKETEGSDRRAKSSGLDGFIDSVNESWFGEDFHRWPRKRRFCRYWPQLVRFAFAFSGSLTSCLAFFIYNFDVTSIDRQSDEIFLSTSDLFLLFAGPISLWFAFLVSYGNRKSGPTRLYLSGLLLPVFVWTVVNFAFVKTS